MQNSFYLSSSGFFGSIAEWYQNSVICEILTYLEETYFTVSFDSYQNFSVSPTAGNTVRNLIIGIAIGIIIASAMAVHTKRGVGGFVRKLLAMECTSPESAKTLSELGYFQNLSIRRELKKGVTLSKLVLCVEEGAYRSECSSIDKTQGKSKPFEIDFSTMHFYVPEDLRYRAEVRFEKKGSTWTSFLITLAATVVGAALLCIFLPDLFRLADNIITWLSPK